jgi:hypothetical protein
MKFVYLIMALTLLVGTCAAHEEINITFNENNTYTIQGAGETMLQPFVGIDPATGDLYMWQGHIA